MRSLRRRLIIGTALWSAGLFIAVTMMMVHILDRHSTAPAVVHHVFRQWMITGVVGAAAMILRAPQF